MIRFAAIIEEFEKEFIEKYQPFLLPGHFKALSDMKKCRNSYSPKMLMKCENEDCAHQKLIPHSCGNRHCPHCQNHETQVWLQRQLQKLLPAEYFMITFTLPAQLRSLAWYNQRLIYRMLFDCVWETLKTFCLNDKKLGGIPGAIAVLHTHSREYNFHPHVHFVMPAATIDKAKRLWKQKRGKYLFNHKALAKVFRAKMLEAITNSGINLPPEHPKKWVVDCSHVGKGHKALLYLARYLYRGVIREKDILSFDNGNVLFRYKNSKTKKYQTKTLSASQFLWLILQHTLPKGFRRARNFGFLHPNSKTLIKILQWIVRLNPQSRIAKSKARKKMSCPCCGAVMKIVKTRLPYYFRLPQLNPI